MLFFCHDFRRCSRHPGPCVGDDSQADCVGLGPRSLETRISAPPPQGLPHFLPGGRREREGQGVTSLPANVMLGGGLALGLSLLSPERENGLGEGPP